MEFKTVGDLVKYLQTFDQTTPVVALKVDDWISNLDATCISVLTSDDVVPNRQKDRIEFRI